MKEIKKNCLCCGREFVRNSGAQKYCSTCGELRRKKRKYKENELVTCRECGKEFLPTHYISVYCSKECSREWNKKNLRMLRRQARDVRCVECGEKITDINRRKYCSDECRFGIKLPKAKKKKKLNDLSVIARKSNEEGLTYGQYVAKYGL